MITMSNVIMMPLPRVSEKNNRHNKIFDLLSKVALSVEPVASARIASCLVNRGEVISFGTNQKKTHPFQARFCKNKDAIHLHAETCAIKNALKIINQEELAKCTLYICRVKYDSSDIDRKKFTYGLACPCVGCQRAISTFNIKHVAYTMNDTGYSWL